MSATQRSQNATTTAATAHLAFVKASLEERFCPPKPRVCRQKLEEHLASDLLSNRSLYLLAPAGSGKTSILAALSARLQKAERAVYGISLKAIASEELPSVFEAIRLEMAAHARAQAAPVLMIDDVECVDEDDLAPSTRALQLMMRAYPVLIAGEPASDLLAEALPVTRVLTASDLAVRYDEVELWSPEAAAGDVRSYMQASGGIVCLTEALSLDQQQKPAATTCYERRLDALVMAAIEGAAMKEERLLRLGIALLGQGTAPMLVALGIRCSYELLESSRIEAPVLGIEQSRTSFCMLGDAPCPPAALALAAKLKPDMLARAVKALIESGKVARAIKLVELTPQKLNLDAAFAALPIELYDAGGDAFIQRVSHPAAPKQLASEPLVARAIAGHVDLESAAKAALHLAGSSQPKRAAQGRALAAILVSKGHGILRFNSAHQLAACALESGPRPRGVSKTLEAWQVHCRARAHLRAGKPQDALQALAAAQAASTHTGLSAALLAIDEHVARALMGEPTSKNTRDALSLHLAQIKRLALPKTFLYEQALVYAADVLAGKTVCAHDFKEALTQAAGEKNEVMRGVCMTATALIHLAHNKFATARADAAEALYCTRNAPRGVVADLAGALKAVCDFAQGRAPELLSSAAPEDLRYLVASMASALDVARPHRPVHAKMPGFMAAKLMVKALNSQSVGTERLWRLLGPSWQSTYQRLMRAEPKSRTYHKQAQLNLAGATALHLVERTEPTLEVNLLGGLELKLYGRILTTKELRRSSARNLLGLLAIRGGHALARERIMDLLWPDSNKKAARANLYSAISCAKTALGDRLQPNQHLLTTSEMVALNGDCVACDIDGFERQLTRIQAAPLETAQQISLAQSAIRRYGNGTYIAASGGARDEFLAYHDWLESRFVEVLTQVAATALSQNLSDEALELVRRAHELNPEREDVVKVLIESLARTGRVVEAEAVCASCTRNKPPAAARAMRTFYMGLFEEARQQPKTAVILPPMPVPLSA